MKNSVLAMGCFALLACGGGSSDGVDGGGGNADARVSGPNDVEPMLIAGGGVGSGAVHGEINVHVVDDETGATIPGATVRIEAATPLENVTDSGGLAVFIKEDLIGAQTVTVVASGYAAATWFGVNGANVTVPVAKNPRTPVPSATVSGTIDGWSSLPAPSITSYTLAVVLYSWSSNYGSRENTIAQPMNGDTPANFCIRTAFDGASCNWTMKTRVGKQVHYAVIVDGDTNGTTNDASDDTYTIIGYAVKTGLDLSAGQTVTNETLTIMPLTETPVSVQFANAPAGVGERSAFPFIDAGDAGQLVFPLPTLTPGTTTSVVPALSGPFAGMNYLLVGLAVVNADTARPYSATFDRGVSFAAAESQSPFLELPAGLAANGDTYSFTPAPGASTHLATLADASDNPAWTVLVLDGSSSFTLPALSADPRAGRSLSLRVTAVDIPGFNSNNFQVGQLTTTMARVSEASN